MKKLLFIAALITLMAYSCTKDKEDEGPKIVGNLDNYAISALVIDGTNTLWAACDSGLFMAVENGYQLIELGLDLPVKALAYEEGINTMWVGTNMGIYKINLSETDTIAAAISQDLVSNSDINSVLIDENAVKWFGTAIGITRNEGETWQKENFKRNATGAITQLQFYTEGINSIGVHEGSYFFATAGNKLWRTYEWNSAVDAFSGATMWDTPYNGSSITDTMYVVFIDSQGVQWFGGKAGVQIHAGDDPKSNNYTFKDELPNERVHAIAEAPNGDIWIGTENGIAIFDGSGISILDITLPNKFITSILFHNSKALIGTKKGFTEHTL